MFKKLALFAVLFSIVSISFSQNTNDILNLLTEKKIISQQDADSLRADAAIKQQEADSKKKSYFLNATKQIQLTGYAQFRYQALDEHGKIDGFDVRRARLNLKANISPFVVFQIQPEFAGSSVKLLDAFGEIKIHDAFNLVVGQQKVALSLENQASDVKYEAIDRSQVVEALVARGRDVIGNFNGRDIGIQVNGALFKSNDKALLDYQLGLFNGNGSNPGDNNEGKDVAARVVFHPITGLDLGASYYNGLANYGSPARNHGRNRFGFEGSYENTRFSLRSEYLKGKDWITEKEGYYILAACYILPQKLQITAKYDSYDPDLDASENLSTWYVIGANYYFNPNVNLKVGYSFRNEEGKSIDNNVAVAQLHIGF